MNGEHEENQANLVLRLVEKEFSQVNEDLSELKVGLQRLIYLMIAVVGLNGGDVGLKLAGSVSQAPTDSAPAIITPHK